MYFLHILIELLAYFLPRGVAVLCTRGIARFCYYLFFREAAKNHLDNLMVAFGGEKSHKQLKEITKEAIYNFAAVVYEHSLMERINERNYSHFIKAEHLENLIRASLQGRGVIVLSAHIGNYEWGTVLMKMKGFSVAIIALDIKTKFIMNVRKKNREKAGIGVFYVGKIFSEPIRFLKKGGVLAIAEDRNFDETSIKVKLFNRETEIPKGAFYLAARFNVPLVPAFSVREKDGLYHVYYEESYSITEDEMQKGAERYAFLLEQYIKKYPEQWYVFDRIWEKEY
ncbi:lysophospholipid acyltransferase family protein [candidate division WOR-3 bacterium]|nr:lysophospholipid acyltransferase family protein [candidate division WOR-3 bacterium]MCK4526841.1 lysophospholipid acyltransferase family protein [candidate division WOR-3 bacterium]